MRMTSSRFPLLDDENVQQAAFNLLVEPDETGAGTNPRTRDPSRRRCSPAAAGTSAPHARAHDVDGPARRLLGLEPPPWWTVYPALFTIGSTRDRTRATSCPRLHPSPTSVEMTTFRWAFSRVMRLVVRSGPISATSRRQTIAPLAPPKFRSYSLKKNGPGFRRGRRDSIESIRVLRPIARVPARAPQLKRILSVPMAPCPESMPPLVGALVGLASSRSSPPPPVESPH